jgi:hypothetical protein
LKNTHFLNFTIDISQDYFLITAHKKQVTFTLAFKNSEILKRKTPKKWQSFTLNLLLIQYLKDNDWYIQKSNTMRPTLKPTRKEIESVCESVCW